MEKMTCTYGLALNIKCFDQPLTASNVPSAPVIYSSFKAGAKYIVIPTTPTEGCTAYINSDKIIWMQLCRECETSTVTDDTCVMDDDNPSDDNGEDDPSPDAV